MLFKRLLLVVITIYLMTAHVTASERLLYEILEASDQRNATSNVFDRALAGNVHNEQKEALLALGRIGDAATTMKISAFLYSKQPDIRSMAAFALGISGDTKAQKVLQLRLTSEQHPLVIEQILTAIGNLGEQTTSISSILPFLNHQNDQLVAAACDGLTLAWTFHRDRVSIPNSTQVHRLFQLIEKNDLLARHCLFTLSRLRQDTAIFDKQQLAAVAKNLTSTTAKILALRIMSAMKDQLFLDYFILAAANENSATIRAEAAAAIATLDYQESLLPTIKSLANDQSSHVKINLIDNLTLTTKHKAVVEIAEKLLKDDSQWVRARATIALFASKGSEMKESFLSLLRADDFSSQQLALEILRQHQLPEQQSYLQQLALSKHQGIKSIASKLLNKEDADAEILQPANKTIPAKEALRLAGKRLQITTSRGEITIQLLTSAAYTSANFYQLAASGFYDGLIFHRVIPNFVAQGGDPEGTGQGGPGYSIREELYPVAHNKGTVGMATSGKDTGGAQFFFNNSDNLHLNNNYTVFGRIVAGADVIDKIEMGDRIITIKEI